MAAPYTDCWTVVANLVGLPALSLPSGRSPTDRMPVGTMLMGRPRTDHVLLGSPPHWRPRGSTGPDVPPREPDRRHDGTAGSYPRGSADARMRPWVWTRSTPRCWTRCRWRPCGPTARGCCGAQPMAARWPGADTDLRGAPLADALFDDVGRGAFDDVLSVVLGGGNWMAAGADPAAGVPRAGGPVGLETGARDGSVTGDVIGEVTGALVVVVDSSVGSVGGGSLSERLTRLARVAAELLVAEDLDERHQDRRRAHGRRRRRHRRVPLAAASTTTRSRLIGIRGGREGAATRWATYPGRSAHPRRRRRPAGPRPLLLAGRDADPVALPGPGDRRRRRALDPLPPAASSTGRASASPRCPSRAPRLRRRRAGVLPVMADTCAQALDRVQALARPPTRPRSCGSWPRPPTSWPAASTTSRRCATSPSLAVPVVRRLVRDLARHRRGAADPGGRARRPRRRSRWPGVPGALPAGPGAPTGGSYQVLPHGTSELIPEITDEMIDAARSRTRSSSR